MKADKIRSELPAAADTLSVSGFARASAMNSPSVFTFRDVGAESAITMVVTFVIGIALRIVRQFFVHVWVCRVCRSRNEQKRVFVVRAGECVDGDEAIAARPVLDHHR